MDIGEEAVKIIKALLIIGVGAVVILSILESSKYLMS